MFLREEFKLKTSGYIVLLGAVLISGTSSFAMEEDYLPSNLTHFKSPEIVKEDSTIESFISAGQIFLARSEYKKAEKRFKLALALSQNPQNILSALYHSLKERFFDKESEKQTPAHFRNARDLYTNILTTSQGNKSCEIESVDNIGLAYLSYKANDFEQAIKYAEAVLKKEWPPNQELSPYIRIDEITFKKLLAESYYRQKNYEKVMSIIENDESKTAQEIFWCAHSYLMKSPTDKNDINVDKLQHAFLFFHQAFQTKKNKNQEIVGNLEEVISVFDLISNLLNTKERKKRIAAAQLVVYLNNDLSFDRSTNPLPKPQKSKKANDKTAPSPQQKKEEMIKTILKNRIDQSKILYENFDKKYLFLWEKTSKIFTETKKDFFKEIDSLAKEIGNTSHNLVILEKEGLLKNTPKITQAYEKLLSLYDSFDLKVIQANLAIDRLQKSLQKNNGENPEFAPEGTTSNLKKEFRGIEDALNSKIKTKRKERVEENLSSDELEAAQELPVIGRIKSFADKRTERIWEKKNNPISENDIIFLKALDSSSNMRDLRTKLPLGAKLEVLTGKRKGQISLRLNHKYRLCFSWTTGVGASNVEIINYH